LTNLSGIPYTTFFGPNVRDAFVATNHLDYGHFVFTDDLEDPFGRIPVSLKRAIDCNLLRESAMATGAFPLGLAARPVSRMLQYIKSNPFINLNFPEFNQGSLSDPYKTINVDGGVLNNEPFDRAEDIFKKAYGLDPTSEPSAGSKHYNSFRYSILMIDPFPSTDFSEQKLDIVDIENILSITKSFTKNSELIKSVTDTLKELIVNNRILNPEQIQLLASLIEKEVSDPQQLNEFKQDLFKLNAQQQAEPTLKNLLGILLRTVRNQLLFKKEDIGQAFDSNDYSRFMIVPKRYSNNGLLSISGSKAIACGSFGGFGGFVSKEFRNHDFFLGRMNCKRFLQKHFGVPLSALESNPIFKNRYSPEAIEAFKYADKERLDATGQPLEMVPIIPLINVKIKKTLNEKELPWPYLPEQTIYDLRDAFKQRSRAVLNGLFTPKKWWWKPLVGVGVWVFDGKVADTIIETIIDDFREHRLLEPTNDISKDLGDA
jgi:hypothetical protein